ncbi:MAG TPA: TolC family outer membrane protein [Pseudorhodoplanes sp.]|jgi:outer membrane protein|nr:TolC family outer membrane protein [Pseudorhodoplanes sp.]
MPRWRGPLWALFSATLVAAAAPAWADTLETALIQAYQNNPQINAQRAVVRATDENVPQALSGYRPRLSVTATVGEQYTDATTKSFQSNPASYSTVTGNTAPRSFNATGTQTLFNGFQTANRTRQAESQVLAARETLRVIEQTVLLDAATAYMNLLRDTAILDLQKRNVEVLQEQLRQTRDRFNVGEVTRTDVAQAESRLAAGQSQMLAAQANVTTSRAVYRRVIGVEPNRLTPGAPVDRFSPRTLDLAVAQGQAENPAVVAAAYGVDVAALQVKISEGQLYPTVSVTASVTKSYETTVQQPETLQASVLGQVSIPLYQGGGEFASIRQNKETLGQRRIELALNRDQARANVVQSWGQLEAAKAQIQATQAQVAAAEIALNGVREEARVGQRTTLDVLNAQQELVNARVALVTAQRDRVVASYTLLASVGRLAIPVLGLQVPVYDPMVHYQQVRDSWFGVRTPDGR